MRLVSTVLTSILFAFALSAPADDSTYANSGMLDTDGDSVYDDIDNCTLLPNTAQTDTDGDGYGNVCDGDFNNDCQTNILDLARLRLVYFSTGVSAEDMDGDGVVGVVDLGLLRLEFFGAPGPSAFGNCPSS